MRYGLMMSAAVLALMTPAKAFAQKPHANVGVLTCTFVKPQDAAQKMMCGFKSSGSGAEEKYSGSIQESGKDLPPGKLHVYVTAVWLELPKTGNLELLAAVVAPKDYKDIKAIREQVRRECTPLVIDVKNIPEITAKTAEELSEKALKLGKRN